MPEEDVLLKRSVTGEEVRLARASLQLTQNQLGILLGVSHSTVRRWHDKGVSGPTAVLLSLLGRHPELVASLRTLLREHVLTSSESPNQNTTESVDK